MGEGTAQRAAGRNGIELICFDLGGVIVRICRSWEEGCATAGVALPPNWRADATTTLIWRALTDLHQSGRLTLPGYAGRVSRLLGGALSAEEITAVHDAWMFDEYDEVGAVIDAVHAVGRRTAALSNTSDEHWARLERFPTIRRMHWRLASHQLRLCKPDPAIYRAVEERVGHVGNSILFFDDLEANVAAARRIGWRAERIDPLAPTAPQLRAALARHGIIAESNT